MVKLIFSFYNICPAANTFLPMHVIVFLQLYFDIKSVSCYVWAGQKIKYDRFCTAVIFFINKSRHCHRFTVFCSDFLLTDVLKRLRIDWFSLKCIPNLRPVRVWNALWQSFFNNLHLLHNFKGHLRRASYNSSGFSITCEAITLKTSINLCEQVNSQNSVWSLFLFNLIKLNLIDECIYSMPPPNEHDRLVIFNLETAFYRQYSWFLYK